MFWLLTVWAVITVETVVASRGDNSNEYNGCYHTCHFNNCSSSRALANFESTQSLGERMMLWSCDDECKYLCMWRTTQIYLRKGLDTPQFFGKWPFVRIFGMQEPAAVLFSILNLMAHLVNLRKYRRRVPSNAPLYKFWHLHAAICVNAWVWSVVFHARDTPWTERMDYFCAFSMVLFSLFGLLIRLCGPQQWRRKEVLAVSCIVFFSYHVWYLSRERFDYGYNMKVNVIVGILNGAGWIAWAIPRLQRRPYVWMCIQTVAGALASMLLELGDFPPLFWALDAHALWHLATSPLPFMWYRFLEGDCLYLLEKSSGPQYRKNI